MPEQICSPCAAAEPALLTVGPSFPRLAGGFLEDTGCRLHPGEAGDAPLKPPSPAATPSPALGDKKLQILGMFKTAMERAESAGGLGWREKLSGDGQRRGQGWG